MYAYIVDGVIAKYPFSVYDFRMANPNVSLPMEPTVEQLNEVGLYKVKLVPKPGGDIAHDVFEGSPELVDDQWVQTWQIVEATPEVVAQREEEARQQNKAQATQLLTETDWSQMPDVNLANQDEFTAYRALLRELAVNPPVTTPSWPSKPNAVWSTIA